MLPGQKKVWPLNAEAKKQESKRLLLKKIIGKLCVVFGLSNELQIAGYLQLLNYRLLVYLPPFTQLHIAGLPPFRLLVYPHSLNIDCWFTSIHCSSLVDHLISLINANKCSLTTKLEPCSLTLVHSFNSFILCFVYFMYLVKRSSESLPERKKGH